LPQEALERALRAAEPMAMVATDGGAAELLAARSDAVRVSGEREAHSRTMAAHNCTARVVCSLAHAASVWNTGARAGRGRSARQIECSQGHGERHSHRQK
jgi:hypothetical protein